MQRFRDISITKKLFIVMAIMAVLITTELVALTYTIKIFSAVRAYVGGEGLWSKAQKDGIYYLEKYAYTANEKDYQKYLEFLAVPRSDHQARLALSTSPIQYEAARQGFLGGSIHPDDIDGIIWLFTTFNHIYYIHKAIDLWDKADELLANLQQISDRLHTDINTQRMTPAILATQLSDLEQLNSQLTAIENEFSYTLGEGSRWLENLILKILISIAITVEFTGIFLTLIISLKISREINAINKVAREVATSDFSHRVDVTSSDEIGQLAMSFNTMIDELDRHIKHQHEIAYFDSLTGLANRAQLMKMIKHEIKKYHTHHKRFAIIFLDLDNFKLINDTLGHKGGDSVLKIIAERLARVTHKNDLVSRFGGDEYILLIKEIKSVQDVIKIADAIAHEMKQPVQINQSKFHVTTSIGVSVFPENGDNEDSLLQNADIAMYRAKLQGGDNYQICTPAMMQDLQLKHTLTAELSSSLERGQFVSYYQPLIDIHTGMIMGAEVLLRLVRDDGTLLLPSKFIPLTCEMGLITPVTEWLLRTACLHCKKWQKIQPFKLAINISEQQLRENSFPLHTRQILEETGFDPQCLAMEITEEVVIHDRKTMIHRLNELRQIGVNIVLDDFGVGHSSLSYLKQLPIDAVKIDPSFIQHIPTNPADSAIVTAIITMAHAMNIKTIAEGVETREQLQFLVNNHCDKAQGYFFSRPLSETELLDFVKKWARLNLVQPQK